MEGIIDLHHNIFFFLIIILVTVLTIFQNLFDYYLEDLNNEKRKIGFHTKLFYNRAAYIVSILDMRILAYKPHYLDGVWFRYIYSKYQKFTHNSTIEIIWTIIPSIVLILIAIPSFMLLYAIDEVVYPQITIKIIGHQWFWSYESYDLFDNLTKTIYKYDSYMVPSDELNNGQLRLLEVDLPLYLPIRTHIRLLITSSDVLHAWAVPALGIKMDAVPGRLNQVSVFIKRAGTFYGQCSEICGINHGFMPIVVHAISINKYVNNFIQNI